MAASNSPLTSLSSYLLEPTTPPLVSSSSAVAMAPLATIGEIPNDNGKPPFDIVSTYHSLLNADPDLTMPVAAIEALILLLSHSSSTTISETLNLLETSTAHLKRSVSNPISLSAGTDLFQRYLITTLQRPNNLGLGAGGGDFRSIRQHLLSNGRLFVKRAKESRRAIAEYARRFVRDGSVVLTLGGSRVVGAVLRAAAEARSNSVRFQVIHVQTLSSRSTTQNAEGHSIVSTLRALHVPVAVIPDSAVAYSMGKVSMVLVGAEGVVENGGIISRMGTYQMGLLAKSAGKPFYVVAESHKFVRLYPLGQYDLPIEQKVLNFMTDETEEREDTEEMEIEPMAENWVEKTPALMEKGEYFETVDSSSKLFNGSSPEQLDGHIKPRKQNDADAVDYTPPDLITALITESGVHTPSAVSEELIKIWY